jgi:hypothetical protein
MGRSRRCLNTVCRCSLMIPGIIAGASVECNMTSVPLLNGAMMPPRSFHAEPPGAPSVIPAAASDLLRRDGDGVTELASLADSPVAQAEQACWGSVPVAEPATSAGSCRGSAVPQMIQLSAAGRHECRS